MKVMCEKHPELHVFDLGVKFSKGVAEVEDVDTLRKLSAINGFGFVFEEELPAPKPSGRGKKADDGQGETD